MTTSQPTPTTAAPSTLPPYPAPRQPFEPSPSNYLFLARVAVTNTHEFDIHLPQPSGIVGLFPTAEAAHVALRKAIERAVTEWNTKIHTTDYENGDGTVDIYGYGAAENDGPCSDDYSFEGHVQKFAVPGKSWGVKLAAEQQPGSGLHEATAGEEVRTTAVRRDVEAEEQQAADELTLAQQPDTDEEAGRKRRHTDDDDIPADKRQRTQEDLDVGSEWPTNVFLLRQLLYQVTDQEYYKGFVSAESTTLYRTLAGANARIRQCFRWMTVGIDRVADLELLTRVEKGLVERQDGTLKFDTSGIDDALVDALKVWVDRVVVDVAVGESPADGEGKSEGGKQVMVMKGTWVEVKPYITHVLPP